MTFDEDRPTALPPEVTAIVDRHFGPSCWKVEFLTGDASLRQNLRIRGPDGKTAILTYYPETVRSQLDGFVASHQVLSNHLALPSLITVGSDAVLQYDAGETTLKAVLRSDPERGRALYRNAIDQLVSLRSAPGEGLPNPPFDAAFFLGELEMTNEFYVRRMMQRPELGEALTPLLKSLARTLTGHPYVVCHRDFHGENIHVEGNRLWVIDFQDARMGPDTYDVASLLRDRGVVLLLGKEVEEDLLRYYAGRVDVADGIESRYWESLLQRTIKIIGTFARQSVERGRHHYLDYIPSALDTLRDCIDRLPGYHPLLAVFPTDFHQRLGD